MNRKEKKEVAYLENLQKKLKYDLDCVQKNISDMDANIITPLNQSIKDLKGLINLKDLRTNKDKHIAEIIENLKYTLQINLENRTPLFMDSLRIQEKLSQTNSKLEYYKSKELSNKPSAFYKLKKQLATGLATSLIGINSITPLTSKQEETKVDNNISLQDHIDNLNDSPSPAEALGYSSSSKPSLFKKIKTSIGKLLNTPKKKIAAIALAAGLGIGGVSVATTNTSKEDLNLPSTPNQEQQIKNNAETTFNMENKLNEIDNNSDTKETINNTQVEIKDDFDIKSNENIKSNSYTEVNITKAVALDDNNIYIKSSSGLSIEEIKKSFPNSKIAVHVIDHKGSGWCSANKVMDSSLDGRIELGEIKLNGTIEHYYISSENIPSTDFEGEIKEATKNEFIKSLKVPNMKPIQNNETPTPNVSKAHSR